MDENMDLAWGRRVPGEIIDKWPKDENGEPVPPALLTGGHERDMADTIVMNMLEAYGIPSFKSYPHFGGFAKVIMGMSAENIDIFVPETMLEDARALLEGENGNEEL